MFPGEKGAIIHFHKTDGHFYHGTQCADKQLQFLKAFHLPTCWKNSKTEVSASICVGRLGGNGHNHSPALRENVEYKVFRWQACLYILQNSNKDVMDAIKAVYAEWPFEINFFPPRLFQLMGLSLRTYKRYGSAEKSTKDYESGHNFLKNFPQKNLDKFIEHLHTSPEYWTPPKPRKWKIST